VREQFSVLMFIVTVALIAGCGSSNTTSTSSLTKAEFIKQADAICLKSTKGIEADFSSFAKERGSFKNAASSKSMAEFSSSTILPALSSEAEKLRALGAPGGEEDDVDAILTPFEVGIEERENAGVSGHGANPEIAKANKLAAEYGLKVCVTS